MNFSWFAEALFGKDNIVILSVTLKDKLSESPPQLNPRKPLKETTTGKAKPNTYGKVDERNKKNGNIPIKKTVI